MVLRFVGGPLDGTSIMQELPVPDVYEHRDALNHQILVYRHVMLDDNDHAYMLDKSATRSDGGY